MSSKEEEAKETPRGGGNGELAAAMEQLAAEGVRALHARAEAEWGPVLRSACQTAAARALWAAAVRDPAAGVLAGERCLRGLHDKMMRDERAGAREVSGVMVAVRTLWFDARLQAAVASLGAGPLQVVLLGAGSASSSSATIHHASNAVHVPYRIILGIRRRQEDIS